jgi:small-conductance mechanosensitive channel
MTDSPTQVIKEQRPEPAFSRAAGVLALISGVVLIASGVTSGSLLLTILSYVDKDLGPHLPFADNFMLNVAITTLTFLVGLGGILVIIGAVSLLLNHRFLGRLLIGLGGGMAVFGLLFSMIEAFYVSGFSSLIFHQSYFTLYWVGAILATTSILLSRKT